MDQRLNKGITAEYRNTTEATTWGQAYHFSLPSIFIRAGSYHSDEQVRELYLNIFLEENYMKKKILLPFWLFLLRLHCWLADAAERTVGNNQFWLAGNEVQSMDAYDALEAKTSQVILKQPGMKQWVLTGRMKFVASSSLQPLRYSLPLNSNVSRDCSRIHVNFYHLPWEHLILMSWNVD